ncbi:hypothetical protein [Lentiprolixibacter aurantiacus]|uniref:Uncharacterized protein n=1 Tax=Lentiprolixibacter aurantiacus TaxID=2993939 RepID=A0AAE3SMM6_9FLAO|nr:hypothetical protein [Lentiprolixibacter aurantiacus]MCX2718456.1 hypothetical protein [Lentiprolixibacter aurantiacus]
MKNITGILFLSLLSYAVSAQELKQSEIDSLMSLDFQEFDQDMQGGWRYYGNKMQFDLAASLIKTYLEQHPEIKKNEAEVMRWHAGQMYAMAGENELAIPLMESSRKEEDLMRWNEYLDATVAFLKKDRKTFDENIKAVASFANNPNLRLLKILEANFDKSYREALMAAMKK